VKILLDLQGAQTESRQRGIGRYSIALARGIIRNAGDHDIWIGLSGAMPGSIAQAKDAFRDLLPEDRMLVWQTVTPTAEIISANDGRVEQAQVIREAFIDALAPDLVHCSSVIEGAGENSVTSINRHFDGPRTAATLYDLIPLVNAAGYLPDFMFTRWYHRRLAELRRADVLLAISESSQREGREFLSLPPDRLVNIRSAVDDIFVPKTISRSLEMQIRERYGIHKSFAMYAGGIDPRKNVFGLVSAYALLPAALRDSHQLVLVGKGDPLIWPDLINHVHQEGLSDEQVIFTGFVPDDDMVDLYNLSKAFVFPSQHEGFGLPPLEAMSCGTPTIAGNASSLPEVIGNPDALFDAYDNRDMATKMERLLTDEGFRRELGRRGLLHAKTFSWDSSAVRALSAFEAAVARPRASRRGAQVAPYRPRLAFVTAIPAMSTLARAQFIHLIQELDHYYNVDIVTSGDLEAWQFEGPCHVMGPEEFDRIAGRYDRIVHHFMNDSGFGFVRQVQALHPGIVLLDDYYLDLAIATASPDVAPTESWILSVIQNHGYDTLHHAMQDRAAGRPAERIAHIAQILEMAHGVMVTDQRIVDLARADLGPKVVKDWITVPLLVPGGLVDGAHSAGRPIVAAFGNGSAQRHHRLIASWINTRAAQSGEAELVIVGQRADDPYGRVLTALLKAAGPGVRWRLIEEASAENILNDLRFVVQLSASPDLVSRRWSLVCRAHGIPVLDGDSLSSEEATSSLGTALAEAWKQHSVPGRQHVLTSDQADAYRDAIERLQTNGALRRQVGALRVASQQSGLDGSEWATTALAILRNDPPPGPRQLLLDVTSLVMEGGRTGIQRVSRNLARLLLLTPPDGFRVQPVYCDRDGEFRLAHRFSVELLGYGAPQLTDPPAVVRPGDLFLGLDINIFMFPGPDGSSPIMTPVLEWLRSQRVNCQFVVYDLLPTRHPEWFVWPPGWFSDYLRALVRLGDGLICISKSTADDVKDWIRVNEPGRQDMPINWFHLGADIETSDPADHITADFERRWNRRGPGPSILMVGTIEPRKGHDQVLAAFGELWRTGAEVNLVIVGKAGWGRDNLINSMRSSPQWDRQVLWFDTASDSELIELYRSCDGCLMASRGEGFGLPLIEAASYDIPLLARDLSVLHEVAGDHASYFSGESPEALAVAVASWLPALADGTAPRSGAMPWRTWEESAQQFVAALDRNLGA